MNWYFARFFGVLLLLFGLELTVLAQRVVVEPWTSSLTHLSALVARAVFPGVSASSNVLTDASTGFAVAIIPGCNGIEAVIVLAAAMLAFKTSWRHRIIGLLGGFLAVQTLNVARVVSLFALGIWRRDLFDFAHLYLWQLLIMVDVLIVWLLWLQFLPCGKDGESRA